MIAQVTKSVMNHVFVMVVALIHLHVLLYSKSGTVRAEKLSGCPFKVASSFFGRQTSFITNSFLFRAPSALSRISMTSDVDNFFASSQIVQYTMTPESIAQASKQSTASCDSLTPTSTFYSGNLETFIKPKNDLMFDKSKKLQQQSDNLEVIVLGLSHHNSRVEVREKLAIPEAQWNEAASALCEYPSITEATVLSTCNRFEIYLAGPNQYEAIRDAVDYLSKRSKGAVDHTTLKNNMFMLSGEDAVWHLLRVSSGMDSLIVGEGQILAQVKRAYEHGLETNTPVVGAEGVVKLIGGRSGKVLANLFKTSITCGKRVRTETDIAKGSVSISSAAAGFSQNQLAQDCGITSGLKDSKVAIIGAGKMTRLLLNHMVTKGVTKVTIVNRSLQRIAELQSNFPTLQIIPKLMNDMYNVITEGDVVFTSTSSVDPIISALPLKEALSQRTHSGGVQIVDISVPRNVHAECESISTESHPVKCYNVDDLNAVVAHNTNKRRKEMVEAEYILKEESKNFMDWQQTLCAEPTILKLQKKAREMRLEELNKFSKQLSALSPKDRQNVKKMTLGLADRFMRGPMNLLRNSGHKGTGGGSGSGANGDGESNDMSRVIVKALEQQFGLDA